MAKGYKSMPRDGEQKGGLESGTCHKMKIGNPDLGQDAVGKNQKPKANPRVGVSRGQTLN